MPQFSADSKARLAKAHPKLQALFNEVIKEFDCVIMQSQRGKADQEKAFREGHSKAHFGQSAHNWDPAVALDVAPFPVDWNNVQRFKDLAKVVLRIAEQQGTPIEWGGTWKLGDFPHYELKPWREWAAKSKPYAG